MTRRRSTPVWLAAIAATTLLAAAEARGQALELSAEGIRFPDGSWLATAESPMSAYSRVLVVAQSGGHFTSVQEALDAIGDSLPEATEQSPYLIWVAPGVYEGRVTMKEWVDIQGCGELATIITHPGQSHQHGGTIQGADNAALRHLTVENTGGDTNSVAVYNNGASPRLTHVTAKASGGYANYGIYNYTSSSPTLENVTATAHGGTISYAVVSAYESSPVMRDVIASAVGAEGKNTAFHFLFSSATLQRVDGEAAGGEQASGLVLIAFSPHVIEIHHSSLAATGGSSQSAALDIDQPVRVAHTQLHGSVHAVLDGECTGVGLYDGSFQPLDESCQPIP